MARHITLIRDITPETPYPWTAKVLVTEKSVTRDARSSPVKYQKYALTDSTGGVVQLTLFDTSIGMFKDRLQLYKKHYISNATVKPAVRIYQFGSTAYQWSLHSTSVVDEAEDDDQLVAHEYNFISFENLIAYKDSPSPIDLLVIGLHVLPKRQIKTKNGPMDLQEFIVIDRSMTPAIMTLWDPFVKNEGSDLASIIDQKPVFAAIRVRVVPYNGITINTKNNSTFFINPTIPPAVELRSWLYDNMAAVNDLLNSKSLITCAREFGKEATDAITTVSAVSTQTHLRLYNVKCTLQLLDYNQTFVFMSCNICHAKTMAACNATYTCNLCGKPRVSTPRARVEVNVRDSTGVEPATLLGSDAEVFLGCTVNMLHENLMLPQPEPIETIIKAHNKEDVFVQLRVYIVNYLGVPTRKLGAFFIDAPATMANPDANNPSVGSHSQTMDADILQTVVETEDPDLTPEEKQVLAGIIARKKKCDLLLASSTSSVGAELSNITARPTIVRHVACSPVSAALQNAIVESAMVEHPVDDVITNAMSEETSLEIGKSIEGPHAKPADDDNWDELIKDAGPPKKNPIRTTESKAKRKLDI